MNALFNLGEYFSKENGFSFSEATLVFSMIAFSDGITFSFSADDNSSSLSLFLASASSFTCSWFPPLVSPVFSSTCSLALVSVVYPSIISDCSPSPFLISSDCSFISCFGAGGGFALNFKDLADWSSDSVVSLSLEESLMFSLVKSISQSYVMPQLARVLPSISCFPPNHNCWCANGT